MRIPRLELAPAPVARRVLRSVPSPVRAFTEPVAALLRPRVRSSLDWLFEPQPLPHEHHDAGLFGPRSMVWRVHGDLSVFVGAIRALVVQAMHPEVVAGVADHSAFRDDPLGRLRRTSAWVTRVTYAPTADALEAIDALQAVHERVTGVSERGRTYHASDPALLAWVHNSMVDSFLEAYRRYGPGLTTAEADRYVDEMSRIAQRLGCDPVPPTAQGVRKWLCTHPDAGPSEALRASLTFLANPPLPWRIKLPYTTLFHGALASLPAPLDRLAPRPLPGAVLGATSVLLALEALVGQSSRPDEAQARIA